MQPSLLDLILKGHISRLSAQIWMGFSVLHSHSCGQKFQTKIKISKCLVKNVFKANYKDFWLNIQHKRIIQRCILKVAVYRKQKHTSFMSYRLDRQSKAIEQISGSEGVGIMFTYQNDG